MSLNEGTRPEIKDIDAQIPYSAVMGKHLFSDTLKSVAGTGIIVVGTTIAENAKSPAVKAVGIAITAAAAGTVGYAGVKSDVARYYLKNVRAKLRNAK